MLPVKIPELLGRDPGLRLYRQMRVVPVFDKQVLYICLLVSFGMPGGSWSRACEWDGGPPPLRDDDKNLFGYSAIGGVDPFKVERGSLLKATFMFAVFAVGAPHCPALSDGTG